jgi:signal peptidase
MTENPPKQEKKKSKIKKKDIIEIIIFVVILFSVTFGGYFIMRAALHTKSPMVVVISGSMEPTIYRGDLLFIKGTNPSEINNGSYQGDPAGDIIVFEATWSYSGEPIVHRVIDKRFNYTGDGAWEFQTQGDNVITNPTPDPGWAHEDDVIGVVVGKIRYIGFVKIWLSEYGLVIPLIIIMSLCLVISIVWDLTRPQKEEEDDKEAERNSSNHNQKLEENDDDSSSSVNLGV